MRLPPKPVLVAARRWLELLPTSGGIPRARALLTAHEEFSDLTPTQYATALQWLCEVGLLETVGSPVPAASRVLSAIFEKSPPPWVRDADLLVQLPDELPSDIISVGEALGISPNEVHGHLVASWEKVDTAARERVGAAGEAALVALLERIPGGSVEHVSAWSDGFGYDIAFNQDTVGAHLEVKSTTRVSRFTIYLSRHEYDVMMRDERWVLVTLRLTDDLEILGVGHVPSDWIISNAPRDSASPGSWASCKFEVPEDVICSGIPQLGPYATALLPTL